MGLILRFWIIATLFLATFIQANAGEAENGLIYGIQIGKPLPEFKPEDLHFEMLGYPYVMRDASHAADEFSRLEVVVTPLTGTALGIRAVAEFDSLEIANDFADRMSLALHARFGENQKVHGSLYDMRCPDNVDIRYCRNLSIGTERYFRIFENFVVELNRYNIDGQKPSVYLIFGIDEKSAVNQLLLDRLDEEGVMAYRRALEGIQNDEAEGLLKGIK